MKQIINFEYCLVRKAWQGWLDGWHKLEFCEKGIQGILGIKSPVLASDQSAFRLDVRDRNPKKKGFMKIRKFSNYLKIGRTLVDILDETYNSIPDQPLWIRVVEEKH